MTISIITAVYNNAAFVEEAILSVLSQTYKNIEYIVVDGGSTDGTLDIINKYKSRIATIISEPDKGIYDALNKGIAAASSNIVGLLHSDDIFASNTIIESIVESFEKSNCQVLYGNLLYVSKENTNNIVRKWISKDFKPGMLQKGWMPAHPTVFVKREIFDQVGRYNLKYKIAADYDWMLRVLKTPAVTTFYLPQVVTLMRVGGASNKSLKNIIKKSHEDYLALKTNKIGGFLTLFFKNFGKIGQFLRKK